jgi:hypothetical protein
MCVVQIALPEFRWILCDCTRASCPALDSTTAAIWSPPVCTEQRSTHTQAVLHPPLSWQPQLALVHRPHRHSLYHYVQWGRLAAPVDPRLREKKMRQNSLVSAPAFSPLALAGTQSYGSGTARTSAAPARARTCDSDECHISEVKRVTHNS